MAEKPKTDIKQLFLDARRRGTYLKICAPMVRYSKLQFRRLVRHYGVDACFTPMIVADSFCRSAKARRHEFETSRADTPLVAQFAARTAHDFVGAAEHVYAYADGVDLNCGCPQRWAIKDGYGCALLAEPATLHALVRAFRNRVPADLAVSAKIRLLSDERDTVELCRALERCGLDFVTVHARKAWQKSGEPPDVASITLLKSAVQIPVVGNGNVRSARDADAMFATTRCDGVMAAQGLLANPAMFAASDSPVTPLECVQRWIDEDHSTFQCFHHHLVFMLERTLRRREKRVFNNLTTREGVLEFLEERFGVSPRVRGDSPTLDDRVDCVYKEEDYSDLKVRFGEEEEDNGERGYDPDATHGKYFLNVVNQNGNHDEDGDYDLDDMFREDVVSTM